MDEKEAEDIVKDSIVVDMDCNGQQWIYHSTFGSSHPKSEMGFLLWSKFSEVDLLILFLEFSFEHDHTCRGGMALLSGVVVREFSVLDIF